MPKKWWILYTILRIPDTQREGIKCVLNCAVLYTPASLYNSIFLRIRDKYGFTTLPIFLFPAGSVIARSRPLNRYIPYIP